MKHKKWLLGTLALSLAILACALNASNPGTPEGAGAPTPTSAPGFVSAESGGEVAGPQGTLLTAGAGALSADTTVVLDVAGEGTPFAEVSPLDPASPEFEIDLGGADVHGLVTFSIPLSSLSQGAAMPGTGHSASPAAAGGSIYVAQTYTDEGYPRMLGVKTESDKATFQVIGSGLYQLYSIVPFLTTQFAPLNVPSYAQLTPAWCSPTALTDLVQYHQGAWPAGGDGSLWGESSNYYLAGKAGQPFDSGYFFHWLINAGGFAGVPGNVKQGFATNDLEVMIWFVGGGEDPEYNEFVWNAFRAYVESYLWGENMARRPVAWGSSLAGHSRIITGSDGTDFFYNETGNGGINLSRSWQDYHDDAVSLADDEVIDTTVLFHDPRPAAQRRGVLRLTPQKPPSDGSVVLHRGTDDAITSLWHWDGTGGRDLGYYYDDPLGLHTPDPELDVAWRIRGPNDYLTYEFTAANIGTVDYAFTAKIDLYPSGSPPSNQVGSHASPGSIAPKAVWGPETGDVPIAALTPGLYTLRFRLFQGAVLQDVKYVKFRIAPPAQLNPPPLMPVEPFIPLGDPELSTHELFYRGLGCGPKQLDFRIRSLDPKGASIVLFYRLMDGDRSTPFNEGVAMRPQGDGFFSYELIAEDVPDFVMFDRAMLQYQFVLTDAAGKVLGRSPVFDDVSFQACHQ